MQVCHPMVEILSSGQTIGHCLTIIQFAIKIIMNSEKNRAKGTQVARPNFLNKIKALHNEEAKENLNSNVSYSNLPRSKSNRKNHSLQRKQPVNLSKYQINMNHNLQKISSSLQQTVSFKQPIINNQQQNVADYCRQKYNNLDCSKLSLLSLDQLLQKQGYQKQCQFKCVDLQQQQEVLDCIKIIWESISKMKKKLFFVEEILGIEFALKKIIMKMAKPKFNSIEQASNITLKIPLSKHSPLEKWMNLQNTKDFRVSHFKTEINPTENPEKGIELKKIMYILEQNQKKSMQQQKYSEIQYKQEQIANSLIQFSQEVHLIDKTNLSLVSGRISSKNNSSFHNYSQSERSGVTMCQVQKMNSSHSNDRIFLKNIVKRANSGFVEANCTQQNVICAHSTKTITRDIQEHSCTRSLSSINSQDQIYFQKLKATVEVVQAEDDTQYKYQSKTLQTVEDDSESKRAVLNQIISMLNVKYNKNIKLQPPKN